jgi:hypothetical protein
MSWRTSELLATWTWALEPRDALAEEPASRARFIAEVAARLVEALDGFAHAHEVAACTASEGEDAFTADVERAGAAPLLAWLEQAPDVQVLDVSLALACRAPDGAELRIEGGAALTLDIELDEHGRLADDPFPCQLRFALHVDLYSPESRGKRPDRALADVNGPRLRAFLERLERLLPLRFLELEARGYNGAHRYGFDAP